MSVLIKGMQMPKCCRECDAEGHYDNSYGDEYGFFCPFGYKAYTSETRELKRLDNCPLIPVPPHGRCVDADALDTSILQAGFSYAITRRKLRYTPGEVREKIANAPTIIPASEEG